MAGTLTSSRPQFARSSSRLNHQLNARPDYYCGSSTLITPLSLFSYRTSTPSPFCTPLQQSTRYIRFRITRLIPWSYTKYAASLKWLGRSLRSSMIRFKLMQCGSRSWLLAVAAGQSERLFGVLQTLGKPEGNLEPCRIGVRFELPMRAVWSMTVTEFYFFFSSRPITAIPKERIQFTMIEYP